MSESKPVLLPLFLAVTLAGHDVAAESVFDSWTDYGAGDVPGSVVSADLDGATGNDLAVANSLPDNVSILLNLTGPYTRCSGGGRRGHVDDPVGPAGEVDVAGPTYLTGYLFQGGLAPAVCR